MTEPPPIAADPAPALRRFAIRIAALYVLTGVAWFATAERHGIALGTAVYFIFLLAFLVSAAVPAWVLERRWIRASLGIAVGAFLAAWVLLLAIDGVFGPPAMLGCRMHEASEGGLPDAICMGPLPLFSSGRRAWWYLPLVAAQALYLAFAVAMATRAARWAFHSVRRRMGWRPRRISPRWRTAAMALGWVVPGAMIAAALVYDPVLEARRERREEAHQAAMRLRGPTASVLFRTADDSLEVGDTERLVAWALYSKDGVEAETLDSVRLAYASLAPRVATVDSTGLLHALSPGSVRITVTAHALGARARLADGKADTVRIRVTPADAALRNLRFVDVAASPNAEFGATCALATDGAAYCWEYTFGQGGEDEDGRQRTFTRIAGPEPFATITLGLGHRCAVARSGRGYCWGDNTGGQLGIASRRQKADAPMPVAGSHAWRRIVAGARHSCGVDVAGALFCWGSDRDGELAPAAVSTLCPASLFGIARRRRERWRCALEPAPVLARMRFREVGAGGSHTCALAVDGAVWCWGANYNHQSSPAATDPVSTPARSPLPPLAHLSAGPRHNCALDAAGRAFCWGWYGHGEVTDYDPGRGPRRPLPIGSAAGLRSVSSGNEHACGIDTEGRAWCWGSNFRFELGSGVTRAERPSASALPVAGGLRFRAVAAGDEYSCGVTVAGGLYCWGSGLSFRFAGGNHEEHPQPFRLAGPPG